MQAFHPTLDRIQTILTISRGKFHIQIKTLVASSLPVTAIRTRIKAPLSPIDNVVRRQHVR